MGASLTLWQQGTETRRTESLLNTEVDTIRKDFEAFCLSGRPTGGAYELEPSGTNRQWILVRFDDLSRIEVSEGN